MPRRVRGTDATALLTGARAGIADFFDQLLLVRSLRMSAREDAYARHQQARWMRSDAHRWMRQDAARFLKPDTEVASGFPSLEGKYNPSQPRVPAGRGRESGRWTDGSSGGGSAAASPMGRIDFGDLPSFSDLFALFQITPSTFDNTDFAQLAGDVPDGERPGLSQNEGPSHEPPEIPPKAPEYGGEYMKFIRQAADWVRSVGRSAPYVDAYFGALTKIDETNAIVNTIKSANDPPRSLEELQDRVNLEDRSGYHRHHIAEERAARRAGFSEDLIQGRDNVVLVPILRHIEISSYYSTKTIQPDGIRLSPRDRLDNMTFEERRQFGLSVLRDKGVLK